MWLKTLKLVWNIIQTHLTKHLHVDEGLLMFGPAQVSSLVLDCDVSEQQWSISSVDLLFKQGGPSSIRRILILFLVLTIIKTEDRQSSLGLCPLYDKVWLFSREAAGQDTVLQINTWHFLIWKRRKTKWERKYSVCANNFYHMLPKCTEKNK